MEAPRWLDELALTTGPVAHTMGTRALDPAAWFVREPGDRSLIELRERIVAQHRADVIASLDGSVDAIATALRALGGELRTLDELAVATAEDVCVVARDADRWVLVGGVVCFPSMWRLPEKLGLSIARVHDPVPRYAEELERRVDQFLDRLRAGAPVWRRNWFVHGSPDLFLPCAPAAGTRPRVPDDLWLRSERQTLAKVDDGVIVFGIRTQQVPLASVRAKPDVAARMGAAVRAWPEEIAMYRGASAWRDGLADWLAEAGAGG